MAVIQDLFKDYLILNKSEVLSPDSPKEFWDLRVDDLIILRKWKSEYSVNYLFSGMSLHIPSEYFRIIYYFQMYSYEEISRITPENNLEKIILGLSRLSRMISRRFISDSGQSFLESLKEISRIGTKDFRDFIKESLGFDPGPWKLRKDITNIKEL